ncbi:cysteine desulfurase family protein [Ferrovibrio sp.]|uniref:cysteine desulfurase family protein n=1 Tax=Ferrovibrio sp. TaxID=1917215 RepID=UPI001B4CDFF3|nr:cysteine desulfurase family protein [Ferrovibrio sp.]MBP7065133.1 cysteine desulfurase [Ferrovibrio sp.]
MSRSPLYLDHNATAPMRPEAREAMLAALAEPGNPSSIHAFGRRARSRMEAARAAVAALVGAEPAEILFTSGGTEANNLALEATPAASLIVSALEHDSVLAPARVGVEKRPDRPLYILPALPSGQIDLAALERLLAEAPRPALLALMLANNETGVVQPVAEAGELVRAAGGLLLVDAVQAAGKLAVDFSRLQADMMSLSGHKLGGPAGSGALVLRGDLAIVAQQVGGGQELGRRAGTENLAGIAGFGAAAAAARRDLGRMADLAAMRDAFEATIRAACQEVVVHGASAPRLPNTSCLGMPGVAAELQVMAFDLAGIAVSAGAACSSGKMRPSHVLRAMGQSEPAAREAVRFSFGWTSQPEDADRAAQAWIALYRRKRG